MDIEIYITLITKQLSGELSEGEKRQLSDWMAQSTDNQRLYEQVVADWELAATAKKSIEVNVAEDFSKLKARIHAEKNSGNQKEGSSAKVVPLQRSNNRWLYIAASIVILATAWFVFSPDPVANQLAFETTLGETRSITLQDGTKIWLNENSKLEYPDIFEKDNRTVSLQGEGYFDVAKNAEAPFKVRLKNTTIEVLGTQFNISENESKDEVLVHVDEGKVRFSENTGEEQIILTKNQAARYGNGHENILQLEYFNKNSTSWKSNSLIFAAANLSDVLEDITAHFGISAVLEQETMKDCIFSGYYPKPDANKVLSNVASSFGMTLTQDRNGNYLLKGGACNTQE